MIKEMYLSKAFDMWCRWRQVEVVAGLDDILAIIEIAEYLESRPG